MKDRIREIRKHSGLNQDDFAKRIGLSKPGLQSIEYGKNGPSEGTIRAICSEFHINRAWLETGIGPMFLELESDIELIDEWLDNCTEFQRSVLLAIIKTPGGWDKLAEILQNLQEILGSKKPDV